MLLPQYLDSAEQLCCPLTGEPYDYHPPGPDTPADEPILRDHSASHAGARNALLLDGRIIIDEGGRE